MFEPKGYRFDVRLGGRVSERLAPSFLDERTRMVWVETPTNPLLNIVDIAAVAEPRTRAGACVVVDNTFATPYLQRPLELGADVVVHSTTKYLGGHSRRRRRVRRARTTRRSRSDWRFLQNALGAVPGPLDSWLVLRGLKTLAIRMRQHSSQRARIAEHLEIHPAVERVRYPGLATTPARPRRSQMAASAG